MPEDRRHTSLVRKLVAIILANVAGYSALMHGDEDQVFKLLRKNRYIYRFLKI